MTNEYDKFEITDADIFSIRYGSNSRTQTKEDATYGIWSRSFTDENYLKSSESKLKVPMSFVSGGYTALNTKTSSAAIPGNEDIEIGRITDSDGDDDDNCQDNAIISSEEEIVDLRPTKRKYRNMGYSHNNSTLDSADLKMGGWERHTKGIGQKLLKKMGYKAGKGLGKGGDGRLNPIEAHVRKGRGAIGAYGRETPAYEAPTICFSSDEDAVNTYIPVDQWKKGKEKLKIIYKTMDDLKDESELDKSPFLFNKLGNVKVIDMTGPETKILGDYTHLSKLKHVKPEKFSSDFNCKELLHNIDIMISINEKDIIRDDKRINFSRDSISSIEKSCDELSDLISDETSRIIKLKKLIYCVKDLHKRFTNSETEMRFLQCQSEFNSMIEQYADEFAMFGISDLFTCLVQPLIKKHFANWSPHDDPTFEIDLFKTWLDILRGKLHAFPSKNLEYDVYGRLCWEVWLPPVRTFIVNASIRDCDSIITLLEAWKPFLPAWLLDNVLQSLIFSKLHSEVQNWNPLTDHVPIHSWLHPWLPLMDQLLEQIYPIIRLKLGICLKDWHPADKSAYLILKPWQNVFCEKVMMAFLSRHITPKLVLMLDQFEINPKNQRHLDWFKNLLMWTDIIGIDPMCSILDQNFFLKWNQVLCCWLNQSPDYNEVSDWYKGWKNVFPEQLLLHRNIESHLNQALSLMNRTVQSNNLLTNKWSQPPPPPPIPEKPPLPKSAISFGFKDLIEKKATDCKISFNISNRNLDGKQLFMFGNQIIYIENNVIYRKIDSDHFSPVALQTLINICK